MNGKVVLITGASSGIGYATTQAFARRNAGVTAVARRADRLADLEREIAALPAPHGDCLTITADVTDAEAIRQAVAQAVARFGRLDVLVANAGVGQRGTVAESEWSDLEAVLRTDIDGVLHTVRAAVPALRASGGGQVVIVSSIAGSAPTPYTAVYGASKAFVSSLARSLRFELEADHIGVTELLIGPVDTEFSRTRRGVPGYASGEATNLPTMSAEQVAEGIVTAVERRSKTAVLRPFDRFVLLLNLIAPGLIGQQSVKRYRTR